MTGLDPGRDVIVEIATLVTDDDLEIVAEGPDLVIHHRPRCWPHGADRDGHAHAQRALHRDRRFDDLAR